MEDVREAGGGALPGKRMPRFTIRAWHGFDPDGLRYHVCMHGARHVNYETLRRAAASLQASASLLKMHDGTQMKGRGRFKFKCLSMPASREISWVDQAPQLQDRICPVLLAGEDRKLTGAPAGSGFL